MTDRPAIGFGLALALVVLTGAHAQGQTRPSDEAWRWEAFVGCWQPVASLEFETPSSQTVCLAPGAQPGTIDRFVIVANRVVSRERVDSTDRHPSTDESCPGWEQAEWSADARRVYRRGEYLCPGGITRTATGLMALTPDGDWLDVMSVASGAASGVRVQRYRPASGVSAALPAETVTILEARSASARTAQTAASAAVSVSDIVDVSAHVSSGVTQAWLSELGQPFTVTGSDLVALADAGVPGSVTDVLVALAYPKVFTLQAAGPASQAIGGRSEESRAFINAYDCGMNLAVWVPGWNGCGFYGAAYYGLYGPRYGYGSYGPLGYGRWYSGGEGAIIVIDGGPLPPAPSQPHGRVVKGEGYVQGRSVTPAPTPSPAPSSDSSGSSSSSSSSSSSETGGGSSSGSSAPASSGGERTAHPR